MRETSLPTFPSSVHKRSKSESEIEITWTLKASFRPLGVVWQLAGARRKRWEPQTRSSHKRSLVCHRSNTLFSDKRMRKPARSSPQSARESWSSSKISNYFQQSTIIDTDLMIPSSSIHVVERMSEWVNEEVALFVTSHSHRTPTRSLVKMTS